MSRNERISQIDQSLSDSLRQQIERIADECERIKPLVVIDCLTYNHEAFLSDALDGFVMQKTDFPFVAVVHDDASTDGTASVLKKYAERYPDIIFPIFEEENQYPKRNGVIRRAMNSAKLATGAKYVAMCEGDDYWTYEYKLQKQVDFLESHPEYSLVFHDAKIQYMDEGGRLAPSFYHQNETREYSAKEIFHEWIIPTASVLYRKKIVSDPIRINKDFQFSDNVLFLTAAKHGKLYGIFENWSVYRLHKGGIILSSGSQKWNETMLAHAKAVIDVFGYMVEKKDCKELLTTRYLSVLETYRNFKQYKKYYVNFLKAVKDCGFTIVKHEWMHFVEITGKYKKWR